MADASQPPSAVPPPFPNRPWRVLLVEDDALVAESLAEALQRLDAIVLTAENGRAALHLLETLAHQGRELPDVLITDLRMPEMSGIELIRALHERRMPMPGIVAMSADGQRDDLLALMRLGVTEFLEKPFSRKHLYEQMERVRHRTVAAGTGLEAENKKLRDRLTQWEAKESLSRVTRGILHDVHNCLAIITGSAEMIKMALESGQTPGAQPPQLDTPGRPAAVDRYADSITEITRRAVENLHQLQALNRMGEGLYSVFDLRRLVAGTQDLVRTALDTRLEITLALGDAPLFIQGDAVTLQHAWIRLLFAVRDALPHRPAGVHIGAFLSLARVADAEHPRALPYLEGRVAVTLLAPGAHLPTELLSTLREILGSQGARLTVAEGDSFALQLQWPAAALPLAQAAIEMTGSQAGPAS